MNLNIDSSKEDVAQFLKNKFNLNEKALAKISDEEINGEKEIQDKTKLDNIQNVGGNEKYTLDNGKLAWESNGKDIYYQGSTKEELPFLKVLSDTLTTCQ